MVDPLHHGACRQIADAGADKADRIDAEMIVEAPVFGGDHRTWQIGRQPVQPHIATPKPTLGEHGAVGGKHGEVRRPVVEGEQDRVWQAGDEIEKAADDDECDQGQGGEKAAQQGAANGACACAAARGLAGFPCGRTLAAAEMRLDALFPLWRRLGFTPRWHGFLAPMTSDNRRERGAPGAQRLAASH